MRLTVTLESTAMASIQINYNYFLSSLIYENLPDGGAQLYDTGFPYEKRKFRLFTFSRLRGPYTIKGRDMIFKGKLEFVFTTAIEEIASDFAKSIIGKESVRLGSAEMRTSAVYVHEEPELSSHLFIRASSPITMYSTLLTSDGKKKTYYYSPYEKEFSPLIDKNLRKKYAAIHKKEYEGGPFKISPIGRQREVIVDYKGTIIKGWTGIFELSGDTALMKIAYDAGIGGKNSEGFGCFDIIRRDTGADGT